MSDRGSWASGGMTGPAVGCDGRGPLLPRAGSDRPRDLHPGQASRARSGFDRGTSGRRIQGSVCFLAALILLVLGFEPNAHAQSNGVIAYTKTIDEGLATQRRAVFRTPGVQLTFPFGAIGKDSDSVPSWSPDGKQLAFVRQVWRSSSETERVIMVVDADGTERVVATEEYAEGSPSPLSRMSVRSISWSPSGNELAIGGLCSTTGFSTHCARRLWVDAPAPNFWGDLNGLLMAGPGLDWSIDGIVHRCPNISTLPSPDLNRLFCVYRNEGQPDYPTAVDMAAGGEPDPTGVLSSDPSWVHDPRGNRVLFDYTAIHPTAGLHGITPADPDEDPDTFLGRGFESLTEEESVACSTRSETRFGRRFNYSNPSASPDGKYILVLRSENVPDVSRDGSTCTYRQVNAGIYVLRKGGIVQNVVAMGEDVGEPAWQPSPANLKIVIDDGYDDDQDGALDQLRGLRVELYTFDTEQRVPIPATNPTGGEYVFEAVPSGDYRLVITLTDADGGSFEIRHGFPETSPVWAEFLVFVPAGDEQIVYELSLESSEDGILRTSLDQASSRSRLAELAAIYWQLRRFVDWVKAEVTTQTDGMLPFHAFATQDPDGDPWPTDMAAYFRSEKIVLLGESKSSHANRDDRWGAATGHTEWHEYTHHLDATNRARGSSFGCLGTGHAGYVNPSSCDSLVEGVASWLPAEFTRDPNYSGIGGNLEAHVKAWDLRPNVGQALSAEEMALSALLWDLSDSTQDFEDTLTVHSFQAHRAVRYTDTVNLGVRSVWELLGGIPIVDDVAGLQRKLDARAAFELSVDLDGDGSMDVNAYDPLFLMHGFFPIVSDQVVTAGHDTYHYSLERARDAGLPANADVGQSGHLAFSVAGLEGPTVDPRSDVPAVESANLAIEVRDASGTPLAGADVEIALDFPDLDQVVKRRLDEGGGTLVPFELPMYFSHLPEDGGLPPCDPTNARYVTATITARLNGHASTNAPTFDNCQYTEAILAAPGDAALSYTLEFPEDSTPPVTTAETFASGQVFESYASVSWAVDLRCADPEVGGIASGCRTTEYILDGGPVTRFTGPFVVTQPGSHVVEFRSLDAAANAESFQSISFIVGLPPAPTISGFTPSSGGANTAVTITGTGFTGATHVQFNGLSASFTVDSATRITAFAPNGTGAGPITVIGPGGTATSSESYSFVPAPFIAGFTPTSGNVGSGVLIGGNNFIGVTRVGFNGAAASFNVISSTQINAIVPLGATTGQISVTGPGGTFVSSGVYTVTVGAPPFITSFSPTSGGIGTSVTIRGEALTNASSVSFNGVEATFRSRRGSIAATVPAGATTGPIRVLTPGGTATSFTSFVVVSPPALTDFSPTSGAGGSVVTLNGTSLSGTTSVRIGGSNARFSVVSDTEVSATVPKGAKSGPISVTTPGGTATSTGSFTVLK